jgi:hypothetical protein
MVLTWPLSLHLDAMYYGPPGDSTGTIFNIWSWVHAVQTHRNVLGNEMVGAPLGSGWEQLPFFVLPLVVLLPISLVLGAVVAYNLAVLASFPLTAVFTFWLGRELGFSRLGAAFMGLAFAFVPMHVEKTMGHLLETHMELFSGILVFGVRWWKYGRRRDLILMGVFAGLTIWTDPYLAYISAFMILIFFVVSLATRQRPGEGFIRNLIVHLVSLAALGAVAALFLPAAVFMAHRPGTGNIDIAVKDVSRSLDEVTIFSAHLHDYLLPWYQNPWVPAFIREYEVNHLYGSNFTESMLFIGYTVMGLALIALIIARSRLPLALGLALIGVGYYFSLPPSFSFAGVALHAPSYYLHNFAPIYRAYSRFGFLVLLGACLLAGLGLTALQSRLKPRQTWFLAVPFILVAIEFHNFPPAHTQAIYPAPAEYVWLKHQPRGIVAEYPLWPFDATQEVLTHNYNLYIMLHEHPTLNGATRQGEAWREYPNVQHYDSAATISRLRALGVRYVIVHVQEYEAVEHARIPAPETIRGLRYLATFDGVQAFEVSPE